MKVISVSGDDYAALEFEENNEVNLETWENAKKGEIEDATALEFGEVDRKFVAFASNCMDYDQQKHSNFYVVEEE